MIFGRKLRFKRIKQKNLTKEQLMMYKIHNWEYISVHHPPMYDLKPCICGTKEKPCLFFSKNTIYLESTDGSEPSELLFAACMVCGRKTKYGKMSKVIEDWNNDNVTYRRKMRVR